MADDRGVEIPEARAFEPNRWGRNLSLAFSAAVMLTTGIVIARLGVPTGKDGGSFINVMAMGVLGGVVGAWYFSGLGRRLSKTARRLRAAAEGIFVDDRRVATRAEIASAVVLPSATGGAVVQVSRKGALAGKLSYAVPRIEDARAFIRALGQGGAQTTQTFRVAAPNRSHFRKRLYALWASIPATVGAMLGAGALFGRGPAVGLAAAVGITAILSLLGLFFVGANVTVGADGVRIGWLWQKSFVPIGDIERAEAVEGEVNAMGYYPVFVRIHRRSGPPVELLSQLGRSTPFTPNRWRDYALMGAGAVAERINEAIAAGGRGEGGAELATWESELLSRGERAVGAWVAALRTIASDVESFRKQAGGGIDALWGVLEDSAAEPERRAAAAVALSPHLDDAGRDRVRIAAQATAAPRLRIALEAAAEADEEALVAALEDVSDQAPRAIARAG